MEGTVGGSRGGSQNSYPITANTKIPITKLGSLGWREDGLLGLPIVDQNKIVSEALVLAK